MNTDPFLMDQSGKPPIDELTIDPDAQANESSAPDGYLKLRIANYTKAIPDEKTDIVIHSTTVGPTRYGPVDTIENIGRDLATATYHIVKRGVRNGATQSLYKFSFIDHDTKEEVLNS